MITIGVGSHLCSIVVSTRNRPPGSATPITTAKARRLVILACSVLARRSKAPSSLDAIYFLLSVTLGKVNELSRSRMWQTVLLHCYISKKNCWARVTMDDYYMYLGVSSNLGVRTCRSDDV